MLNSLAQITDMDDSVATLNNNSINQSPTSSPDNSDDFVFVPNDIPDDEINVKHKVNRVTQPQLNTQASPPRPSSLPISEPKPIPAAINKMHHLPDTFVSLLLICQLFL